jgi:hypothetical protein
MENVKGWWQTLLEISSYIMCVTYYRYINITAFDRKVDKGLKDILQSIFGTVNNRTKETLTNIGTSRLCAVRHFSNSKINSHLFSIRN